MTEVSTRPHAGATKAPAFKKATPATNTAHAQVGAPSPSAWIAPTIEFFTALQILADSAFQVDGSAGDGDTYASTIDGIAREKIGEYIEHLTAHLEDCRLESAIDIAHDIEALVRGAELAGPNRIAERTALHDSMLGLIGAFAAGEEDWGAGTRPFLEQPMPPIRRVNAPCIESQAHTPEQLQCALGTIASYAETMRQALAQSQASSDDFGAAAGIDAAFIISTAIGALADSMSGENVLGNQGRWHFGPTFAREDKAVQA